MKNLVAECFVLKGSKIGKFYVLIKTINVGMSNNN